MLARALQEVLDFLIRMFRKGQALRPNACTPEAQGVENARPAGKYSTFS